MRAKKFMSLLTSAAICAACIPVVSAENADSFKAAIGLASSDFAIQSWTRGVTIGEGRNILTCTLPKDEKGNSTSISGIGLLVVDLDDCYYEIGEIRVDEILIDGESVDFDKSAVVYGADDGSDSDNFRIELYSMFGDTADSPAFEPSEITVNESLAVVFTVSREGYSGGLKRISGNVVANKKSTSPIPMTEIDVTITTSEQDSSYDPDCIETLDCTVEKDRFSAELKRGIYDITVSSEGYVTRKLKGVRVGKKNPPVLTDLDLRKYGDLNGDGVINIMDVSIITGYVKQVESFSDDYQPAVADCTRDGEVNLSDVARIVGHAKGIEEIK